LVAETDLLDVRAAREAGRLEVADELVHRWVRETLPRTPHWLVGHYLGMHSHWASTLGNRSSSLLYDILLPFRGQWLSARAELIHGSADLHLGRYARGAGRIDQAVAHLEKASGDHERAGEITLRTHAAVELGEVLMARGRPGDHVRARPLVEQAQADAHRIGLAGVAATARTVLGRLDGPTGLV
jgi:hypothetical protein